MLSTLTLFVRSGFSWIYVQIYGTKVVGKVRTSFSNSFITIYISHSHTSCSLFSLFPFFFSSIYINSGGLTSFQPHESFHTALDSILFNENGTYHFLQLNDGFGLKSTRCCCRNYRSMNLQLKLPRLSSRLKE